MEEHYIKDVGKITYVYDVNLEEHKTVIEKQQKRIAELEQELAVLKEKAILPKFRIGQKVWSIFVGDYKEICYLEITHIMKSKSGIFYQDSNNNAYWFNEKNTFLSEQEAQAKLKELKGNE